MIDIVKHYSSLLPASYTRGFNIDLNCHIKALEDINSRLYEISKAELFPTPEFKFLIKRGFRIMSSFNVLYSFVRSDTLDKLSGKSNSALLSYLTPSKVKPTCVCLNLRNGYPCGKCLHCLENKRKPWIVRLTHERNFWAKQGIPTYFVTLTYDNDHLPADESVNKRDIQLFLKRLRKRLPSQKLKYFCVSEYGPNNTHRPHYHLILFGLNLPFRILNNYIFDTWGNGFITVSKVKPSRIKYVTKYSTKYLQDLDSIDHPDCREKEFRLISNGIGINYLTPDVKEYYRLHANDLRLKLQDATYTLPRYYRDKIFTDDMHFKHTSFEASVCRHLDFLLYYVKNIKQFDDCRRLLNLPSVYREIYDRAVKNYVDYTKKNAKI